MKVYGIVRLTKKPEAKLVGDRDLVKCSVAWTGYKGSSNFIDIALWGKVGLQFMNCEKGDRVLIKSATLSDNNYQGKEGMVYQKLVTVDQFEYIEPKKIKDDLDKQPENVTEAFQQYQRKASPTPVMDITSDDLPFR